MLTPLKHWLLIIAGLLSLLVGVIGVFLPLIPTVPLVLLAAYCFARSSERLHNWLIGHRHFGAILRNFESGKGIPRQVKVRAVTMVWISLGFSACIVGRPVLIALLFSIGLGVSIYIWRLPEY
jgi:hypothetical protein